MKKIEETGNLISIVLYVSNFLFAWFMNFLEIEIVPNSAFGLDVLCGALSC